MKSQQVKSETIKLWKCPKCGRQFERQGQLHSCKPFPIEQHFKGKESSKILYDKFRLAVKKQVGPFKIESLECCIHFVSTFTFLAVRILKDRIRVDFALNHKIKSGKVTGFTKMSTHRFLYYFDILKENEIDEELMNFVQEAYDLKNEKSELAVGRAS